MAKMGRDNFKDCRFGEIDFAFSPVFKKFILHKNPGASRKIVIVKSLKDLCIHKITGYTEVSINNNDKKHHMYLI